MWDNLRLLKDRQHYVTRVTKQLRVVYVLLSVEDFRSFIEPKAGRLKRQSQTVSSNRFTVSNKDVVGQVSATKRRR